MATIRPVVDRVRWAITTSNWRSTPFILLFILVLLIFHQLWHLQLGFFFRPDSSSPSSSSSSSSASASSSASTSPRHRSSVTARQYSDDEVNDDEESKRQFHEWAESILVLHAPLPHNHHLHAQPLQPLHPLPRLQQQTQSHLLPLHTPKPTPNSPSRLPSTTSFESSSSSSSWSSQASFPHLSSTPLLSLLLQQTELDTSFLPPLPHPDTGSGSDSSSSSSSSFPRFVASWSLSDTLSHYVEFHKEALSFLNEHESQLMSQSCVLTSSSSNASLGVRVMLGHPYGGLGNRLLPSTSTLLVALLSSRVLFLGGWANQVVSAPDTVFQPFVAWIRDKQKNEYLKAIQPKPKGSKCQIVHGNQEWPTEQLLCQRFEGAHQMEEVVKLDDVDDAVAFDAEVVDLHSNQYYLSLLFHNPHYSSLLTNWQHQAHGSLFNVLASVLFAPSTAIRRRIDEHRRHMLGQVATLLHIPLNEDDDLQSSSSSSTNVSPLQRAFWRVLLQADLRRRSPRNFSPIPIFLTSPLLFHYLFQRTPSYNETESPSSSSSSLDEYEEVDDENQESPFSPSRLFPVYDSLSIVLSPSSIHHVQMSMLHDGATAEMNDDENEEEGSAAAVKKHTHMLSVRLLSPPLLRVGIQLRAQTTTKGDSLQNVVNAFFECGDLVATQLRRMHRDMFELWQQQVRQFHKEAEKDEEGQEEIEASYVVPAVIYHIATDDTSDIVRNSARARWGSDAAWFIPISTHELSSESQVSHAAAEILLLAEANGVVVSAGSTFGYTIQALHNGVAMRPNLRNTISAASSSSSPPTSASSSPSPSSSAASSSLLMPFYPSAMVVPLSPNNANYYVHNNVSAHLVEGWKTMHDGANTKLHCVKSFEPAEPCCHMCKEWVRPRARTGSASSSSKSRRHTCFDETYFQQHFYGYGYGPSQFC